MHQCELCRFTGNSVAAFKDWRASAVGSGVSLFVPGDAVIYVSPTSITHYIDAHGYQPPAEFCDAVLRCPPMRSVAYLRALRAIGESGLRQGAGRRGDAGAADSTS